MSLRAIDLSLRVLTIVTAIGFFVFPQAIALKLACAAFFAVGTWAVVYPAGVLGWVRTKNPGFKPSDSSLWWISRLIGAVFIVVAAAFAIAIMK